MPYENSYELIHKFLRKTKHLQVDFELQPLQFKNGEKIKDFEIQFDFFVNESQKQAFKDFCDLIENPENLKKGSLTMLKNPVPQKGTSKTFKIFDESYPKYPLEELTF